MNSISVFGKGATVAKLLMSTTAVPVAGRTGAYFDTFDPSEVDNEANEGS